MHEIPAKLTPDGKIELPKSLLDRLSPDQGLRMTLLVPEPADLEEDSLWSQFTVGQSANGYDRADSI